MFSSNIVQVLQGIPLECLEEKRDDLYNIDLLSDFNKNNIIILSIIGVVHLNPIVC
jgi:hypothetical protein